MNRVTKRPSKQEQLLRNKAVELNQALTKEREHHRRNLSLVSSIKQPVLLLMFAVNEWFIKSEAIFSQFEVLDLKQMIRDQLDAPIFGVPQIIAIAGLTLMMMIKLEAGEQKGDDNPGGVQSTLPNDDSKPELPQEERVGTVSDGEVA